MRRLLVLLLAVAACGLTASPATAAPCGLPDSKPLWIDFGAPELLSRFGRPGVIVAGSGEAYPAAARAAGAKTVAWDMYLNTRVGTPMAPADPSVLPARAQRYFDFAVLSAGCPDPVIGLNELFGASVPTPWTPTTQRYRENVLQWLRLLREKGGHPVLLVSSEPYTGSWEAAQWWRDVAQVATIALEKYFNAPAVHKAGPELGSRRMRTSMRSSLGKLFAAGVPPSRLGVVLAFQTRRGTGGREGLRPAGRWFEVAKLQALAAKQVARELGIAQVWSWGWGFFNEQARDPDKLGAACVWLWARDPSLCDVDTVPQRFDRDLRAGQIDLPAGVRCVLGDRSVTTKEIAAVARVTRDAEAALAILYARVVQQRAVSLGPGDLRAAEREIVRRRFGGDRGAYLRALRAAGASTQVALGAVADELRRERLLARLRVAGPSSAAMREFAATYAEVPVREIPGASAPPGVDTRVPLGFLPDRLARPVMREALRHAARLARYAAWAERTRERALDELRCTRDRLPEVASEPLTSWMPFLAPAAGTP